ncbi:uncharacterized protein DS421_18g633940 [Arachis hypogaea]|nr:uncharacterized protein DS421_18g633940 [Arachis hypogaea]
MEYVIRIFLSTAVTTTVQPKPVSDTNAEDYSNPFDKDNTTKKRKDQDEICNNNNSNDALYDFNKRSKLTAILLYHLSSSSVDSLLTFLLFSEEVAVCAEQSRSRLQNWSSGANLLTESQSSSTRAEERRGGRLGEGDGAGMASSTARNGRPASSRVADLLFGEDDGLSWLSWFLQSSDRR